MGRLGPPNHAQHRAKEITRIRQILDTIIAAHTGQSQKKVREDTERDHYMTGEEAKKYGLIDRLITQREEQDDKKKK